MRMLPVWSDSFPFKVSYSIHRNNSISIHIDHPAGWARLLLDTLHVLSALADQLRLHGGCAEQQVHIDLFQEQRLARFTAVYEAYRVLRASGKLHRESVRALCLDPAFADLKFCRADFAWCVSLMKGRVESASLTPLPFPTPNTAKRTRYRGRG